MRSKLKKFVLTIRVLSLVTLTLLMIAPVAVYIFKFASGSLGTHLQFGEFGSFLSGVYAPIVGLLTLVILFLQIRAQDSMNAYHIQLNGVNTHFQMVQVVLADLQKMLNPNDEVGLKFQDDLLFVTSNASTENHREVNLRFERIYQNCPRLYELWQSYYFAIDGIIGSNDRSLEEPIAVQLALGSLSYPICHALDRFLLNKSANFPKAKLRFITRTMV
jgi:hypothetical protein